MMKNHLNCMAALALPLMFTACTDLVEGDGNPAPGGGKADEGSARGELAFDDAYLQCFDGHIEIGVYAEGVLVEESMYGMGDLVLDPANVIKIRVPGDRTYVIDKNTIFTTDGAGNDTFHALYLDGSDIAPVIHLYYDHEEGFLQGFYSLPDYRTITRAEETFELIVGFQSPTALSNSSMNCYDYTYGNL